ncbi:MAG: GMP reductase [Alphaproteobacteria bacterium MarineAlpha5_Bin8]|nr:MAG: GMP reductase [Alphaproteobacteria bacterium MarineAlpha5_Bin7]PPR47880.1 MAG: GMP reductase [Alphaproteobacteria bacterium MarineAlpha5_Bin8]|tara:strand:- start:4016 stop:5053 length:1038 start_codon:yes stop_codon:yes gene_type:complete
MRIEEEIKLDYSDVLFRPKRSTLKSRKQVDLTRTYKFKHSNKEWTGVPIIASNMDGVGELGVAESLAKHDIITALTKQHDSKSINNFKSIKNIFNFVSLSTGTSKESYERLNKILSEHSYIQFICIDVANGYSETFSNFVSSVRSKHPSKTIIAGNVVTADMTQELILSGADIVKVGIGPGSVCTTRIQTGVGYPQLSAVIECADAAHGLGAHMIADGGCTCPGDVAKAFGGGADFVMLGGMLAGHKEGGGEIIKSNGKDYIEFYGSSSEEANDKHYGGLADYRSSEGKKVRITYRGDIDNTVRDILGGIRSSCTYVGASTLKQLSKCTTFVRVNNQYNDTFGKV